MRISSLSSPKISVKSTLILIAAFFSLILPACRDDDSQYRWAVRVEPVTLQWGFPRHLTFHIKTGPLKELQAETVLRFRFPAGIFGRPISADVVKSSLQHRTKIKAPGNCRPDIDIDGWIKEMGEMDMVFKLPSSCKPGDNIEVTLFAPPMYFEGKSIVKVTVDSNNGKRHLPEITLESKRLRPSSADGQGTFKLEYNRPVTAGVPTNWSLIYIAGRAGISPGGSLSVVIPHSLYSTYPKTVVPGITAPVDNKVTVHWKGNEDLSLAKKQRTFHSSLDVAFKDSGLSPGEKVKVTFKDSVFYLSGSWAPSIWLDADGDGAFAPVNNTGSLEVSPANPEMNWAMPLSPNAKRPKAVFKNQITDRFGNPVDSSGNLEPIISYPGWISTGHEGKNWKLTFLIGERGDEPEHHSVYIDGKHPQPQIFWGDLHGHTAMSDGTGTPENYFKFARDVSFLDFAAITDHERQLKDNEWNKIVEAAEKFTEPDRFAAISGIEINSTGSGHINLYFEKKASLPKPIFGEEDNIFQADYNGQNLFLRFPTHDSIRSLLSTGGFVAAFHRAGSHGQISQVATESAQPVVEIYSNQGCAEERGKTWSIPMKDTNETVMDLLARGVRVGFIGGSDSHDGSPGMSLWNRFPNGLTAVKAERLGVAEIFDAFRARHTWVTTGARGFMEFRIDGKPEGSEFAASDRDIKIRVVVALPGARKVFIRRFSNGNWSDISIPPVDGLPVPLWDYETEVTIEPGKYIY